MMGIMRESLFLFVTNFLYVIKIGVVVDVECGLIQVKQGPSFNVKVLPLNMVNMMLQLVTKNIVQVEKPSHGIIFNFSQLYIKASKEDGTLKHDLENLDQWFEQVHNNYQFNDYFVFESNVDDDELFDENVKDDQLKLIL